VHLIGVKGVIGVHLIGVLDVNLIGVIGVIRRGSHRRYKRG